MRQTEIRILLVDDDIVDRKALLRFVKENNLPYKIESASSISECRKLLSESQFDLILLDYQLGDGTGIEIMPSAKSTPVIFVTGGGDESIAAEALKLGAYGYLIKDPDQKYLAVLNGTITNVLERKMSEEALVESEIKFRSVTQSATDAIISSDHEGTIISWNNGATAIFGYDEEEVLGKNVTTIMPEAYRESHQDGMNLFLDTGKTSIIGRTVEYQGLRKDGELFPIEMSLSTWTAKDKTFFTAIIRDITERSKFIRELSFAKESAENATQLKDKFISLVSHDLRSPLGTLLGFLRLLYSDSTDNLDSKRKSRLAHAIEIGENMLKLIEELLDIGRLKSGIVKPEYKFFDVGILVLKVVTMYGFMAKDKGVEILNKIPLQTNVHGDPNLLIQVIQNLFLNAIKFCKSGDSISFLFEKNNNLNISIADTGIGIATEQLQHLFRYDIHTSTVGTSGETGTGLGLPLCKEILEAHNGALDITSEPGKGTTCLITLPDVKCRILIVDDDSLVRRTIRSYLKELNIEITEASSGKKALELLEEIKPHLVVTDIQMPEMDGFELTQTIRNSANFSQVPIIILTSDTTVETRQKAFQIGADDFAQKTAEKNDFIARVRRFTG